ncbi:hypothetical protein K456DRAFT_1732616 [Colletotrichum gloeosporioides 23]|nr:hypothetical protein K456DRAFT_1732616 [Colletotrichum gloeosporioides 23]
MEMTLSPIRGPRGSGSDPATDIGPIALGNELLANQWRDEREAVQDPGLLDTHVAICVIVNGSCRWRAPAREIREHSNRATRQPRNSTEPSYDMERPNHSNGGERIREPGTWLLPVESAEITPGRPAWGPGSLTGPGYDSGLVQKRSTSMRSDPGPDNFS